VVLVARTLLLICFVDPSFCCVLMEMTEMRPDIVLHGRVFPGLPHKPLVLEPLTVPLRLGFSDNMLRLISLADVKREFYARKEKNYISNNEAGHILFHLNDILGGLIEQQSLDAVVIGAKPSLSLRMLLELLFSTFGEERFFNENERVVVAAPLVVVEDGTAPPPPPAPVMLTNKIETKKQVTLFEVHLCFHFLKFYLIQKQLVVYFVWWSVNLQGHCVLHFCSSGCKKYFVFLCSCL
jgi:hypothetical protein